MKFQIEFLPVSMSVLQLMDQLIIRTLHIYAVYKGGGGVLQRCCSETVVQYKAKTATDFA